MSITEGFEIRKPDPRDENYDHDAWSSWKKQYFAMWIGDWLHRHIGYANLPVYYRQGDYQSIIIPKEALLRMADDLLNRRFDAAPEWASDVEDLGDYTTHYGRAFKELAEKVKDDEVIIYYWEQP